MLGPDEPARRLAAPLISKDTTETTIETEDWGDAETKATNVPFVGALATALLVTAGLATSAAAIVSVQSIAVYVACGICILNSPIVAVKQYRIYRGAGVRESIRRIQNEVELLQEEEIILQETVDDLREEVECLHDIQKELNGIADEQHWTCNDIIALVNENESILQQMKDYLREVVMADITRLVLRSDKDGDMKINPRELKILTLRIKLALEERGIDLDEELFMACVRTDNNVAQVLKVVAAIMFEEEIDEKSLSEYAIEALEEMKRQDRLKDLLSQSSTLGRLRRFAGRRYREDVEEEEDVQSMFLLQDRYTKGSVDVARGVRVTLARQSSGSGLPSRSTHIMRKTATAINTNRIVRQAMEKGDAN